MAYHVKHEGCQGQSLSYWSADGRNSANEVMIVNAATKKEADTLLEIRIQEKNSFLATSPKNQLKVLTNKRNMTPKDVKDSVKLIAQILLIDNKEG